MPHFTLWVAQHLIDLPFVNTTKHLGHKSDVSEVRECEPEMVSFTSFRKRDGHDDDAEVGGVDGGAAVGGVGGGGAELQRGRGEGAGGTARALRRLRSGTSQFYRHYDIDHF